MADNRKGPNVGPISLSAPVLGAAPTPTPAPPLRAVRGPPETCCYAHDAQANQHEVGCLVGMIYRVSPSALDALFEGFGHAVQKAADTLADVILAAQMGGSVTPPQVHAAIEAFNRLREKAVEAQGIVHDREAGR